MPTADLEICLRRRVETHYEVELRYRPAAAAVDFKPIDGPTRFDFDALRVAEPVEYGMLLSRALFADADVQKHFGKIRAATQATDVPLRIRLFIEPSAPELHGLKWELLRDPDSDERLLTNQTTWFSRYLSSPDWRDAHLRSRADLRALVVIANPSDVASYRPQGRPLAPVDVEGELKRAKDGMRDKAGRGAIVVTDVTGPDTLNRLVTALRDDYDILYLVCHGALIDGKPVLWLEDETSRSARVAGAKLVAELGELPRRPRLVVLASCQSAGSDDDDGGALTALGPRLVEAGIPAVLAMQGRVSMTTVARFMPAFFRELCRDGQIDEAMSVARGAVRERPDYWAPVLYMRLRDGRIWYDSGFSSGGDRSESEFERWGALLNNIETGRCTVILGSGLLEPFVGATREIAFRWAESIRFPMARHNREDLPQVAQYLSVTQDENYARSELMKRLREEIIRRYGDELTVEQRQEEIGGLLLTVGTRRGRRDPDDPHRVLAMLPLPIYLTTNPDSLLEAALAEVEVETGPGVKARKSPRVELGRWNEEFDWPELISAREPTYEPAPNQPLVYHLLGRFQEPNSLVLTEDDYFDHLIGSTRYNEFVPEFVRRHMADSALLFLGFRMDEWDFRILLRRIVGLGGSSRRKRYSHVAVQLGPEENRMLAPESARRYLQRYFERHAISIYRGSVEDFARDLRCRWLERHPNGSQEAWS